MDPFLVLLHSVSAGLSSSDLTQLKFLCQNRVSKRKLELAQSGLGLFTVLLEQNELNAKHTALLRELLCSLRREDLLLLLDDFERGAAGGSCVIQLNGDSQAKVQRILRLISGGGLSITGSHILCGDFLFSGHTVVLTLTYLFIKECK